jgi:GPH family glycoside/pentoside/hexuronide:cation symporter
MTESTKYYNLKRKILINLIAGGSTIIGVIINSSLMKYYTDMVGLSPAVYGVVYLIFSIWNAINDPIIGYWADRRPFIAGKGKYAPLIRWSIPVIGVAVIALLFSSPGWNTLLIASYLLVLLVIYEGAQTMLGVSFGAFRVNTFLSMEERTEVQVIATYVNMLPVFLGGMVPIWFMTGSYSRMTLATIFTGMFLLGLVLIFIGSRFVRENDRFYKNMEHTRGLKELFALSKGLFRDKTFLMFMLAFFFIAASTSNYFTGYLYYMDNVLVVSGLKATIPDVLTGIVQMASFPLIVLLVKKFGSRDTLWKGLLLAVIGHAVLSLPINYWVAAATYIVILGGYGFASAINVPLGSLMVDHIELVTGKRQPGVIAGIMAIVLIPAGSMQPLILSAMLSASGYVGSVKVQSAEVMQAIRLGTGIIPAVILAVGLILLSQLPINHKRELEIQAMIEAKHGKEAPEA